MALADYAPKRETVEFPGGEFAVRALCVEDFSILVRDHYDALKHLFDKYVAEAAAEAVDQQYGDGELELAQFDAVIKDALDKAPRLISETIALAADEPESLAVVRRLPLGVQVDAITKIIRLTLEAEGGLEKMMATITGLAEGLKNLAGSNA